MKAYQLIDAIQKLNRSGYKVNYICGEDLRRDTMLVNLTQDFSPEGKEYISIRRARGKYKGNSVGRGHPVLA